MIDLKKFCGKEEYRTYLHEPFAQGDYTYATNGHILVRVPKIDGTQPLEIKLDAEKTVRWLDEAVFTPCNLTFPEDPPAIDCNTCDGRGTEHDCPDCECECEDCGGSGKSRAQVSAKIGGVDFNVDYLRMVAALPGAEISHTAKVSDDYIDMIPMMFRFEGGVGALMPMRKPFRNEVIVEAAA